MFKRISIIFLVLFTLLAFVAGVSATAPGLFVEKDAANTYIKYVDADGTNIMTIDDTDGVTIAVSIVGDTYTSMTVTSTTDATSITTGSITTLGGASIADQLWLGDDIDMTTNTTGIYDITLNANQADALSIVHGTTDIMVFDTDTPEITITPATTITGLLTSGGGITVGASGAGETVTFYGDNAGSDFVWAEDGDTNGSLTLGGSTDGVDFRVYGTVAGNYLHWDNDVDDLLLVGTSTQLAIAGTTNATSYADGSLRTAGGLGVAQDAYVKGLLEVGVNAAGTDFKVFGVTTGYLAWWDASADTNKGTLYIGANTKGVDVFMYGVTDTDFVKWDASVDTLQIADDTVFALGTTLGSAATKVTMEFDDTTTGVGLMQFGTTAAPMVYNTDPGAGGVAIIDINATHSAGAGNAVWLYGVSSHMIISGDGDSGTKLAPIYASIMLDEAAISSAYTVRATLTHDGTDSISGAAAVINADLYIESGDFEADQTLQTAIFTLRSETTTAVTCTSENFNVVLIKNLADVSGLNSLLKLVSGGSDDPAAIIQVEGVGDDGFIHFDAGTDCTADTDEPAAAATHKIKCNYNGTTFYLAGFADF